MVTVIIFLVVLSILVSVHEAGHFFSARRFGIKAEEFGLGFPPRAVGIYKDKSGKWHHVFGDRSVDKLDAAGTVYSLNWLPLGGFVNIKGENGDDKADKDSFAAQKIWKRTIVLAAGVFMNIVLAWFIFSVGYMFGLPQSTDTLGYGAVVSDPSVIVSSVLPGKPAEKAGIKADDKILSLDGQAISTYQELQAAVAAHNGEAVSLKIERDGQNLDISAVPQDSGNGKAAIGVTVYSSGLVHYPFLISFWEGAKTTVILLKEIFGAFGGLVTGLFHGQAVGDDFAGPVGIANVTGQAARLGFSYLLQFVALLSLNLAVINILPLPALDGGRIVFLIIEKIKGKPVKKEIENTIHSVFFFLLIALVLLITYHDIVKLF